MNNGEKEKEMQISDAVNYLGEMLGWNDFDVYGLAWDLRERFGTWDLEAAVSWDALKIIAEPFRQ